MLLWFFFFNDTATTEIYTLSLHDALPISVRAHVKLLSDGRYTNDGPMMTGLAVDLGPTALLLCEPAAGPSDRKSTRLNSSHANISYAVFCLKKNTTSQRYLYCERNIYENL